MVPPGQTSASGCRRVLGPASVLLVTEMVAAQGAASPAVKPNVTMLFVSVEAVTVLPPTMALAWTVAEAMPFTEAAVTGVLPVLKT